MIYLSSITRIFQMGDQEVRALNGINLAGKVRKPESIFRKYNDAYETLTKKQSRQE